jgi:hypothetical protein
LRCLLSYIPRVLVTVGPGLGILQKSTAEIEGLYD